MHQEGVIARERKELVTLIFGGGRFEDHGVCIDAAGELIAYKALLVETAKELWRQEHLRIRPLPGSFEKSLAIFFQTVEPGTAAITLYREIDHGENEDLSHQPDEFDEAAALIAKVVQAAEEGNVLPAEFPETLLPLFLNYGNTLQAGEYINQCSIDRRFGARYTSTGRKNLEAWTKHDHIRSVDIVGTITMTESGQLDAGIVLDNGRMAKIAFSRKDTDAITTALRNHPIAKIRVQGQGKFSAGGKLEKISLVQNVTVLPPSEPDYDSTAEPIWEVFQNVMEDVPEDELSKLPEDAAEQHDHYLYGTRKKAT